MLYYAALIIHHNPNKYTGIATSDIETQPKSKTKSNSNTTSYHENVNFWIFFEYYILYGCI